MRACWRRRRPPQRAPAPTRLPTARWWNSPRLRSPTRSSPGPGRPPPVCGRPPTPSTCRPAPSYWPPATGTPSRRSASAPAPGESGSCRKAAIREEERPRQGPPSTPGGSSSWAGSPPSWPPAPSTPPPGPSSPAGPTPGRSASPTRPPAYEAAAARLRLEPGGRALDLGCGTGRAMPALRAQVGPRGHVLGIDVTPAMLAAAARHGRTRHGHLLAADCTRLPLPGASVHGIFSAGLLDHLPDPFAALREWARVIAADGVLLLFHPSGRAERAARHGRALDPGDLLAEHNLRPALDTTGWHLDEYEDAAGHFLTRAVPRG
ncbi:class I SAM-dependent methyltransferase [Streptomyces sp. NPDC051366]|uniref:class I SAM-dependent methyltransferase n=1 Tax=Streptomyces sp. NPDC051366 TaxID=3365652 RepID=UPI0037B7117E